MEGDGRGLMTRNFGATLAGLRIWNDSVGFGRICLKAAGCFSDEDDSGM